MPAAQLCLWGRDEPEVAGFSGVQHIVLDAWSWLDYVPEFVRGHATLFERLASGVAWRHERRVMYEREVDVPRLVATSPLPSDRFPVLSEAGRAIADRYGAPLDHVGLALYRDGRDSVAMHRDKLDRNVPTLVAILSLGHPRRFLVRRLGGGPSRAFHLGSGDLLVMGGYCQRDFEHGVPKVREAAGPRMSLVFRHVYATCGADASAWR